MGIILFICFILLTFIICSCKVAGNCSRKEEQEELVEKLKGKEYMLDDYRLEEDLVYDDEFVKKDNN